MFEQNVIPVEEVLVRIEVVETEFFCDLPKCKGACCTLKSDYGAPVVEEEINEISEILEAVKTNLPKKHVKEIVKHGFWEEKKGELMLRSVNNKACVFVYYEGDIAKCGIEKTYLEGRTNFKKPISCHLFPIRVSKFGGDVLRYERIEECDPALGKGKEKNISVSEFCSESLQRLYGNKWYSKLKETTGK